MVNYKPSLICDARSNNKVVATGVQVNVSALAINKFDPMTGWNNVDPEVVTPLLITTENDRFARSQAKLKVPTSYSFRCSDTRTVHK
jgi:hypothetical protein